VGIVNKGQDGFTFKTASKSVFSVKHHFISTF